MSYYFNKVFRDTFESAVKRTYEALKTEGFGVISEIDIKAKMQEKLNIDYRNYMILGACNPEFAHKALEIEDKIGTMLPCNLIVQEISVNEIEVAAINPLESMQAIRNEELSKIALQVEEKLRKVVERV